MWCICSYPIFIQNQNTSLWQRRRIHIKIQEFWKSNGITSQRSCHSTLQKNRVVEIKNVSCTIFLEFLIPLRFWCEALFITIDLINHLQSPTINNESPFSQVFGNPRDQSNLCVFIYICYVHFLHKNIPNKLHNLMNVIFFDIHLIKKYLYVMILIFVEFGYL